MTELETSKVVRDNRAMAYLLLRVILGVNIFMHGASRILSGVSAFADGMVNMFHQTALPSGFVHLFGVSLPWIEAVLGFLLVAGFKTRLVLIVGFLLILALTFGVTLRQDWQSAGLQLIYAVIYAVLLAFREYNLVSVDRLLRKNS